MEAAAPSEGGVYVLHFAQLHTDFRVPELYASAAYLGIALELLPTPSRAVPEGVVGDVSRPFMLCRLPSDEAARALLRRCSSLRGVWELWACADTYDELHARNRALRRFEPWLGASLSWKALMQGFNVAMAEKRRIELIESFSYMDFQGPTRMRHSDVTWGVLEEYCRPADPQKVEARGHAELGDRDPRLVQLFLGRKIKDRSGARAARDLIDALDLKKRAYIGNTSMESEMSVVMANMALAGPGDLIYDPFAGTGSMLYACSMLGAYTFGSDIDGRMLRGKKAEGVSGIRQSAQQYHLEGRILDTAVFDMTQAPWRVPFRGDVPLFDAIVTDRTCPYSRSAVRRPRGRQAPGPPQHRAAARRALHYGGRHAVACVRGHLTQPPGLYPTDQAIPPVRADHGPACVRKRAPSPRRPPCVLASDHVGGRRGDHGPRA